MVKEGDNPPLQTRQYCRQLAPNHLGQMVMFGSTSALQIKTSKDYSQRNSLKGLVSEDSSSKEDEHMKQSNACCKITASECLRHQKA